MSSEKLAIGGNIVDLFNRRIFPGILIIENGHISSIQENDEEYTGYILPGLVDAHIHIESSMLVPSEFARIAVRHGTVAVVCDPHEIANVLGVPGVEYMIENAGKTPFKFYFGAPSCVPATPFETAGASISVKDIEYLIEKHDLKFLSEMMNVPGVLNEFPEVMEKLELALKHNRPVDGHSPGLTGPDMQKYIEAGVSTDHECMSLDEARGKIHNGMKIQIREGSAARNFDDLYPLIDEFPEMCMLCSDDKHPDDLVAGHISSLVRRGLTAGLDKYNLLRSATVVPAEHYGLEAGLLRAGDSADFIFVDDLENFNVTSTWINGERVAENGKSTLLSIKAEAVNNFNCSPKKESDFYVKPEKGQLKIMEIIPQQLVTEVGHGDAKIESDNAVSDQDYDILKISVVDRYKNGKPAMAFVRGLGILNSAMASSVAHDSHNIVAAGTNDKLLCKAVNLLIKSGGGISFVTPSEEIVLPLPVGGIMTGQDGDAVAELYQSLDRKAKEAGSSLDAPFMTLSFLALLVIPKLKLSDKGLFDGEKFQFTPLFG